MATMVELGRAYGEAMVAMAKGIEANGTIDYSEQGSLRATYQDYRSMLTDREDRRLMEQHIWENMSPQSRDIMKNSGWFEWRWW